MWILCVRAQETDHLGVVFHLFEEKLLAELDQQQADVIEQVSAGARGSGGAAASKLGKVSLGGARAHALTNEATSSSDGSTRTQLELVKRFTFTVHTQNHSYIHRAHSTHVLRITNYAAHLQLRRVLFSVRSVLHS